MRKRQTIIKNQSGVASMVIVILIMTLLSLIVVSMTKNANREQRQALDRQLNSQAFYAAESGINDAKNYYFANAATVPQEKLNCEGIGGAVGNEQFPTRKSQVGEANNRYTCVLYDANPESLEFTSVGQGQSKVAPLESLNNAPITNVTFKWRKESAAQPNFTNCPSGPSSTLFPASLPANCDAGGLRIELIDTSPGLNRDQLADRSFLAFVLPGASASSNTEFTQGYSTQNQGVIWTGGCSGSECSITINTAAAGKNKFLLHLRSLYMENSVTITAQAGGTAMKFRGAQLMIDSTGRAADVLKRVRVRVPLSPYDAPYPEFAIQTTDAICKLMEIVPIGLEPDVTKNNCS